MESTAAAIKLSPDGQTMHCVGEWTLSGIKTLPVEFSSLLTSAGSTLKIDTSKITDLDTVGAFRLCQLVKIAEESGKKTVFVELSAKRQLIFELVYSNLTDENVKELPPPRTKIPWNCWASGQSPNRKMPTGFPLLLAK